MIAPILYIPHGGGPMPLLNEPNHKPLISFLQDLPSHWEKPSAIVLISAHWEENTPTITSSPSPGLLYDYYGFPPESYKIKYQAPGSPELANKISQLLSRYSMGPKLDDARNFDHGVFVPLKLMYPEANIPIVQISLVHTLDPAFHMEMGKAMSELSRENIMILGSGSSFHNLEKLMRRDHDTYDKATEFDKWLYEILIMEKEHSITERALIHWKSAPQATYAHPREEHLLPLHVCFGAVKQNDFKPKIIFREDLLGVPMSGFLWTSKN